MSAENRIRALLKILLILMLGGIVEGCISANPAPDIDQTAALANDRKGVDDELDDL